MYTPNFDDPRVIKRIKDALGFSLGVLSETESRPWSSRYIDKYFGQAQGNLASYLKNSLLICTNHHYSFGGTVSKCKEYKLNPAGVEYLKQQLYYSKAVTDMPLTLNTNWNNPIWDNFLVKKIIEKEFHDELQSGDFKYRESHHRLFNNLQNYKSIKRNSALADHGYKYSYDISACAPTIIEQLSRRYGNDLWMPYYEEYLTNKHAVRQNVSKDFELDMKRTKTLINSLFCGARIGLSPQFSTSILLDNDVSKILLAKEHEFVQGLKQDIKTAWSYIIASEQEIPRRRKIENNRLLAVTSKDKWVVYFKYERYMINQVSKYLKQKHIKHFLIHDGWSCNREIDKVELEQHLFDTTGFRYQIEQD
jgi:hypothetical protein